MTTLRTSVTGGTAKGDRSGSASVSALAMVPALLRMVNANPPAPVAAAGQPDKAAPPVSGARLEWRGGPAGLWAPGDVVDNCLWEFIRLGAASDAAILAFAQRYGVLASCQHGLPACHADCAAQRLSYGADDEWYWEDLALWRKLARQLTALLLIYHALRDETPVAPELWTEINAVLDQPLPLHRGDAHSRVADYASDLARLANLTIRVRLFNGFELTAAPSAWPEQLLFRTLVIQLASVLCGSGAVECCDTCGQPFGASRKARSDRHKYCATCRAAVLLRNKRECWQRHKDRYMRARSERKGVV